ncbi:hypothetical protein A2U14_05850 [Fusobacterium necrophorum subsp. funduliforme]|uniref:IrrE N-terminal-like domain-containing protein n=1 Tax=Fusobacterium necrophorum subsp. funduliforme TaxID=143387 RepID=A0A162IGN9_9FUSO|nr:ImmA/IrrE family metallo-endopeptidase [Fusobacterium necrophorum]AYV93560.1 ImmA/IrrE family metallo-endopeptidase [Fusobacterium necrophorum subsp. funduliforme]AYV95727.1 ImmA/IrrE family metallo-endopeptidase [Fusobacterium necrophorum subsp. funduliforme]KYL00481.1 hypothetical protein A2J07_08270 [Fusobacterium necrophorum subsp. funduliforme]KYL00613.1 hypothetical protein A2J06_05395 [Fusobacterium necrophorum subsp. funduliforme]KYM39260.1 hypothetical protein A2U03_07920 [Fusobact
MVNFIKIKKLVKKLKKKYNTDNPLKIAEKMNFILKYEDLGDVVGYYKICLRKTYIVLNQKLSYEGILLATAHEICHAIEHKSQVTRFMSSYFFPKNSIYELEADLFALEFLGKDFYIENIEEVGIAQKRFQELENIINEFYEE